MNDDQPKQVVVEREKRSHTGVIVGVVAVVLLVLVLLFALPNMMNGGGTTNEVEVTPPTPAPTTVE